MQVGGREIRTDRSRKASRMSEQPRDLRVQRPQPTASAPSMDAPCAARDHVMALRRPATIQETIAENSRWVPEADSTCPVSCIRGLLCLKSSLLQTQSHSSTPSGISGRKPELTITAWRYVTENGERYLAAIRPRESERRNRECHHERVQKHWKATSFLYFHTHTYLDWQSKCKIPDPGNDT